MEVEVQKTEEQHEKVVCKVCGVCIFCISEKVKEHIKEKHDELGKEQKT